MVVLAFLLPLRWGPCRSIKLPYLEACRKEAQGYLQTLFVACIVSLSFQASFYISSLALLELRGGYLGAIKGLRRPYKALFNNWCESTLRSQ